MRNCERHPIKTWWERAVHNLASEWQSCWYPPHHAAHLCTNQECMGMTKWIQAVNPQRQHKIRSCTGQSCMWQPPLFPLHVSDDLVPYSHSEKSLTKSDLCAMFVLHKWLFFFVPKKKDLSSLVLSNRNSSTSLQRMNSLPNELIEKKVEDTPQVSEIQAYRDFKGLKTTTFKCLAQSSRP